MRKIASFMLAGVLILLLLGAYMLYDEFSEGNENPPVVPPPVTNNHEEPPQLEAAADFTVTDEDGNPIKLTDFLGKGVVLNFWASWCPPCRREMPYFEEAFERYGDEVVFFVVNLTDEAGESVEVAKAFIEEQSYNFPIYFDTLYEAAENYSIRSIPVTYFIDSAGFVRYQRIGALDMETLERGIGLIFPEE